MYAYSLNFATTSFLIDTLIYKLNTQISFDFYTPEHFVSSNTTSSSAISDLCPLPFSATKKILELDAGILTHF